MRTKLNFTDPFNVEAASVTLGRPSRTEARGTSVTSAAMAPLLVFRYRFLLVSSVSPGQRLGRSGAGMTIAGSTTQLPFIDPLSFEADTMFVGL
jgi:hypothetical protein